MVTTGGPGRFSCGHYQLEAGKPEWNTKKKRPQLLNVGWRHLLVVVSESMSISVHESVHGMLTCTLGVLGTGGAKQPVQD